MHNHDQAKPKCLAVSWLSPIPFLSYLLLSVPPYPCSVSSYHSFPLSTLYPSSPYHTLSSLYICCPYLYDYTQTTPFRSPSPVPLSISSLCPLCIPQSKYYLWYSLLWSDPVHVSSLPHPNSPPLTLLKARPQCPIYILLPSTRPDSCNRYRKVSNGWQVRDET